ncbi:ATP-dependent exoDNAse (exonuclease V) beta subunit (contains helicase and exonuclease domains) [Catalinimonas alkaloidigena]|uniref:DNA 3'-5' helicase n=1 Tax=Catalinimonas alkaloidigena TaxID=1075417 RepID=A0A1G9AGZ9_9BACT|nr:UvrD-helicase domain-containing protein [Catalinimonas alkaloidigena]SDK26627.1 ATP-dependent exoDNAse (exonuclease V) beta subunit (contains helicase and exonuclease domains) [Catalinimonas alkaloidigena]
MEEAVFKIYSSSAGSGKTYTLTKEYLMLVLRDPQRFRSVLAVTFTNKATAEMKNRIVSTLADLKAGKPTPLGKELQAQLDLSDEQLQRNAQLVLESILHDYSHFAVSTIDSFFQRILRSFAYEAAQNANYRLEMDQGKVIRELTDQLLLELGQDRHLMEWLLHFAESRVDEGKGWDFRRDIQELAQEIFKEPFKTFEERMGERLRDRDFVPGFLEKVREVQLSFETEMKRIGQEAQALLDSYELTVEDFLYGKSGVGGYFLRLAAGKDFDPKARARQALLDDKWHKKKHPKELELLAVLDGGLRDLLAEAIDLYDQEYQRYAAASEVLRYIYTFGILSDLTRKLQDYRDEHNLLLISDVTRFLNDILRDNDAHYIYEKAGTAYRHFLIDEFQDTSGFQWENFRPLIINSLAEGETSLIVGDVKQSIYRWRGGDWQLLLHKVEQDVPQHQRINLDHNWRSLPLVIDFNNQFFQTASRTLTEHLVSTIGEAESLPDQERLQLQAGHLIRAYGDVAQKFPDLKRNGLTQEGHIQIRFLERPTGAEADDEEVLTWKEAALEAMVRTIEDLQRRGYRPADIALLVRNRREGTEIAQFLLHYARERAQPGIDYAVISSESLMLQSATTVRLLLSALQCLKNPRDRIATALLLQEYNRYILGDEAADDLSVYYSIPPEEAEEAELEALLYAHLPHEFVEQRAFLSRLALYELSESLIRIFRLHEQHEERAYLQGFQDLVLDYSRTEKTDIASFLDWWKENGHRKPVQMPGVQNAMPILTIHKSKGLEYPAVIIPFCSWSLDHKHTQTNILWAATEAEPFNLVSQMPIRYGTRLRQTCYADAYYTEMVSAYLDNLNTLYVAFTRARDALYLLAPAPKKEGSLKEADGLLYRLASEPKLGTWDPETLTYTLGQPTQRQQEKEPTTVRTLTPGQYPTGAWRDKLMIKSEAEDFFEDLSGETPVNWSHLLRDLLKSLRSSADLDTALTRLYFTGKITLEEQHQLEAKAKRLLGQPPMRDWFRPGRRVKTNFSLLNKFGETRRIDRVVMDGQHAIVVEFAGEEAEADLSGRGKAYTYPLRNMGFERIEGYVVRVDTGRIERVV